MTEETPEYLKYCCPRCKADHVCPCDSCTGRREDKAQTWAFWKDDIICLTCGFRAHVDWWNDFDMHTSFPEKNYSPNLGKEIEEISARSTDFRELTWHPYTLTRDHGEDLQKDVSPSLLKIPPSKVYPAGTPCLAARDEKAGFLYFKFEDGGFSELDGYAYYLKGIEPSRHPLQSIADLVYQEIVKEEDERAFEAIREAIENDRS